MASMKVNGHTLRFVRGPMAASVHAQQLMADSEHDTSCIVNASPALLAACQNALPWLVLLGDYIGNGTKGDPEGRCNAIDFIHRALIAAGHDVPNSLPEK